MEHVERLQARGYVDEGLRDAFRAVDRRDHLDPRFAEFADLDVPLPAAGDAPPDPSPRAIALLLRAVELDDADHLLVVGAGASHLVAVARTALDGTVEHVADADAVSGTWDRILWLDEVTERPEVVDHLEELGALVYLQRDGEDLDVVKQVKSHGSDAEMVLTDADVVDEPFGETGRVEEPDRDVGALLQLDRSLVRVWTGGHLLQRERAWSRSVENTWRSNPVGDADTDEWGRARRLFHLAFILQMHGDLETAVDVYTASIEIAPSAEAHTFRGWARSFLGDVDAAIEDCKQAIDVDPSLGNPYNDIGCYLLERGDLDEAEDWFEKAKDADRYEAPHFPYLNLARLYIRKGDEDKALEAARESARINPQDPTTKEILRRLEDESDP